jgi:hypothetical protein
MRGRIACRLSIALLMLVNAKSVQAACVDPAQFMQSTVNITRQFDDEEREGHGDVVAIRGTGWFLSSTAIVTAQHVTEAMKLLGARWKLLEIVDGQGNKQLLQARIQRIAGSQAEKLAIIELQRAFPAARSFEIRTEPLLPEEQVTAFSYPAGALRPVQGRFVRVGNDGKVAGMALLEVYEGSNRLIIDHGASGAPVVDCDGRVAAVVSNVFTQSIWWASREIRVSTPWGLPNVASIPIQSLNDALPN